MLVLTLSSSLPRLNTPDWASHVSPYTTAVLISATRRARLHRHMTTCHIVMMDLGIAQVIFNLQLGVQSVAYMNNSSYRNPKRPLNNFRSLFCRCAS
jgi:hypothetical protein